MANDFCDICPEDCTTNSVLLPAIETDQNCACIEQILTEVCDLYIKPDSVVTAPTAFDTAAMLTFLDAEVDNTNTDNTKIKHLIGIGDIPVPDKTTIPLPKGRTKQGERTYTLTFDFCIGPDSHYDFAKSLQCGDTSFCFWYSTRGGKMMGNLSGITPTSVDADMPLERGDDANAKAIITIQFKACGDPFRIDDPYAG